VAGSLHQIQRCADQAAATKGENDCVGVQGTQASVGQPGYVEIQNRQPELVSDQHPDYPPQNGDNDKLWNNFIVVGRD